MLCTIQTTTSPQFSKASLMLFLLSTMNSILPISTIELNVFIECTTVTIQSTQSLGAASIYIAHEITTRHNGVLSVERG